MNKAAWILALLLLATNAAWVVAWLGQDVGRRAGAADVADLETTITVLQQEIAALERAEPVLLGMDAPGERAAPAAGTGSAAAPEPGVEGGDDEQPAEAAARAEAEAKKAAEAAAARKAAQDAVLAKARETLRKIMQVEDPALRQEGLRELTDALTGGDDLTIEYALSTLYSLKDAAFDRDEFRKLAEGFLTSENGGIRRSALYAFYATSPEGVDPRIALDSAKDPASVVRLHAAKLLALYGGPRFEGEAADAVVGLLEDEDPRVRQGTLRGLSGVAVGPQVERKLIELAADPAQRRAVVQQGLAQLEGKSRVVVDALLTHLDDEDGRVRLAAHQGLQRGVPKAQQLYVASRYAEHIGKFVNPKTHREALKLIVRYGDASLSPQLERFAENELVDAEVREMARKAADYLVNRKPPR